MFRNFFSFMPGLAVAATLAFTGCPGAPQQPASTAKTPNNQATPTSREITPGGTVVLPLRIAIDDPTLLSLDFSDARMFALSRCIAAPLVHCNADGELSPGLAESWNTDDGGKTWQFKLKQTDPQDPGKFGDIFMNRVKMLLRQTDGPLTAQLCDLVVGAKQYKQGQALGIAGMAVEGANLDISLRRKFANFPMWLSQPGLGLMPGFGWPDENDDLAPLGGFAQFRLDQVDGAKLVLSPIDAPLVGDKPLLEALHFVCEPDIEQQFLLYKNGGLHAAEVPYFEVPTVMGEEKLAAVRVKLETAAPFLGCFDLQQFPWGDSQFHPKLGLRQAMNWGLGLDYLEEATNGKFTAWPHFFPKPYADYVPSALIQQPTFPLVEQIEDARAALRRADHWQGNQLIPGMDLAWMEHEPFNKLAIETLRFWKDISVKMKPLDDTKEILLSRIKAGSHEIVLRRVYPAYPHPEALAYPLLHSSLSGTGGNWSLLENPAIDNLLEQAMATSDEGERVKLYQEVCQQLEDEALFVFLGYSTPTFVLSPDLAGYELTPYDFDASLPAQDFGKLGLQK